MPTYRNTTNIDRLFYGFRLIPGKDTGLLGQFPNDGSNVIRVSEDPSWNPVVYSEVIEEDIVISIPEQMNGVGESGNAVQDFSIILRGDDGIINTSNYASVHFNSEGVSVLSEQSDEAVGADHDLDYSPVNSQSTTVRIYNAVPTLLDTLVYTSGITTETLDGPTTDATATIKLNTGTLNINAGTSGAVKAQADYTYAGETTIPSLKIYNKDQFKLVCKTPVVLRELKIKIEGTFKLKVDILLQS